MNEEKFIAVPFIRATAKHLVSTRTFQGIPSITLTKKGRLFAVWYGGGSGEGPENYVVCAISDDGGKSWSKEEWVVDPPQSDIRAFDSSLFTDPDGRVHCFWAQCRSYGINDIFDGRNGVWHSCCENPDDPAEEMLWSIPERICDGVMMNRAVVLSSGEWALPVSVWKPWQKDMLPLIPYETKMYITDDNGKTFHYRGGVQVNGEFAAFDEHSIYELSDGRLGMLIRKNGGGYYASFSNDRGRTWSDVEKSTLPECCSSRGHMQVLRSGKLLALYNSDKNCRRNLTAALSRDGGRSWYAKIVLDLRANVSYPDAVQGPEEEIYIIYDRERYKEGEILCSRICEKDIEEGLLTAKESFAAKIVSQIQ